MAAKVAALDRSRGHLHQLDLASGIGAVCLQQRCLCRDGHGFVYLAAGLQNQIDTQGGVDEQVRTFAHRNAKTRTQLAASFTEID